MDPLYYHLYDSKYYSTAAPTCAYSNEPQIRYGQVVALTFYVWGRPKVHFKRQIGSYQMQDFSIRSHRTYCKLVPSSEQGEPV